MKQLTFKDNFNPNKQDGLGVYSFIVPHYKTKHYLGINLDKMYARKNLALKVFTQEFKPLEKFNWGISGGSNNFFECLQIQNLAALYDLAPRVYDVVSIFFRGKKKHAIITDYLVSKSIDSTDDDRGYVMAHLKSISKLYGAGLEAIDPNLENIINRKYLDFQVFRFFNKNIFKERIIERANNVTDWGSKTGTSYQSVEELNIEGQRDTQHRSEVLKLDEIDFKGKTVLDIGCSTGSFCRYASRKGAKRVVGVDIGDVPEVATEISIYLGDFNIDYYYFRFGKNNPEDYNRLTRLTGLKEFDYVFFLSVQQQIGYPTSYMRKLCREMLFLEGHSADKEETYRDMLEADFPIVRFMGIMKNNARPAFVCQK